MHPTATRPSTPTGAGAAGPPGRGVGPCASNALVSKGASRPVSRPASRPIGPHSASSSPGGRAIDRDPCSPSSLSLAIAISSCPSALFSITAVRPPLVLPGHGRRTRGDQREISGSQRARRIHQGMRTFDTPHAVAARRHSTEACPCPYACA